MFENIREFLKRWNKETEPRAKLQQSYLGIAVLVIAAAGIIGLFEPRAGRSLAGIAAAAVVVFMINAVVWALLQSITTSYITPTRSTRKK